MFDMEPVTFTVKHPDGAELKLRGTRYLPDGFDPEGKAPIAVLFHGFGGNRIDFSGFIVQVARELVSRGMVVITYDRAGHGESDGTFFDTTVGGDVEDALQVVESARHMPGCDPENLHFAGLSLGAVICTLLAPRVHNQPKSITLCSAATSYVDEIKAGHIQGKPLTVLDEQGYLDFMGMAMGPAMVEDAHHTDPYGMAKGYTGNVFAIHGTDDFIPVDYVRRYSDVYGDKFKLQIIEHGNHGFGNVKHREIVMPAVGNFIAEQAGLSNVITEK